MKLFPYPIRLLVSNKNINSTPKTISIKSSTTMHKIMIIIPTIFILIPTVNDLYERYQINKNKNK